MKWLPIILLSCVQCYGANSWFVDIRATGVRNGTNWANAWTNTGAISGIASGDIVFFSGGPPGSTNVYPASNPWNLTVAGVTYMAATDSVHNGKVVITGNPVLQANNVTFSGFTSSPSGTGAGVNAAYVFGIFVSGKGCIITNGECVGFNAVASQQATMIVLAGDTDTITRTTFRDTADIDCTHIFGNNHVVSYNYFTNIMWLDHVANHVDLFQTWGGNTTNVLLIGNYAVNCSCQVGNTEMDFIGGSFSWTFENDIFVNIINSFFSGMPNTSFYNCVFDNTGVNWPACVLFYTDGQAGNYRSSTNCVVFNTVMLGPALDVNNQYAGGAGYPAMPLTAVQQVSNYTGSNPGFVNEPAGNYHLTAGSILRNSGTNLFAIFTIDFDQVGRPVTGPWDRGALQYVSPGPPVTTMYGTQLKPTMTFMKGTVQ